ncbi:MAG: type II toxin-antitoxin system prevent-host-death family antitoxin [FCB group bacterium]|jgi:prevent-host-death family protein|nr:type II toxin-antitoxin system prevent-host-death family antitoxin [FCB group bacterium]
MHTVGTFEAKTHLSQLLERVAKGERITIEKHGVPVAVLHPVGSSKRKPTAEIVAELRAFRAGHFLGELSIRELIEDGRR